MTHTEEKSAYGPSYGLMAEFDDVNSAVAAARKVYAAGYRRINAYSPYPVEELSEAIGFHKNWVPLIVFLGGLTGCLTGFALEYWTAAYAYPINVGGRPFLSMPAYIPIMFELTILFASFAAVIGMLAMNGLPRPYHPVFNLPSFARASSDRFFVCVKSDDPRFEHESTKTFLASLGAREVSDVES